MLDPIQFKTAVGFPRVYGRHRDAAAKEVLEALSKFFPLSSPLNNVEDSEVSIDDL